MKKRLFIVLSSFLVLGLIFGVGGKDVQKASATVPGTNYLVSSDALGGSANGSSTIGLHAVSGNGRYVTFLSSADNLVPNDTNGEPDVFVKDTQTGAITLIDTDGSSDEASDGAEDWSSPTSYPAISYDGRYVVFMSADDLVSGTTGANVYRRDLVNGTTAVVSKNSSGASITAYEPDINADGRYVVFATHSTATNSEVVDIKDMSTGALQTIAAGRWDSTNPSIDCDGHVVAFISNSYLGGGAPQDSTQIYFWRNYYVSTVDWNTNSLTYIGQSSAINDHTSAPEVSCDGNMITAYGTKEYNRLTQTFSYTDSSDNSSSILLKNSVPSNDGRYVAFTSKGTNLDTSYPSTNRGTGYDTFIWDGRAHTTQLLSFTVSGYMSGHVGSTISLSPDGSTAAYAYQTSSTSDGNELISGDDTGQSDIYISKTGF